MKENKKAPWFWLRDTRGDKSTTITLVFISFMVTTVAFLLGTIESAFGINFRAFDVAACSAYFVPIITLYFGRRYTEAKHPYHHEENKEKDKD